MTIIGEKEFPRLSIAAIITLFYQQDGVGDVAPPVVTKNMENNLQRGIPFLSTFFFSINSKLKQPS